MKVIPTAVVIPYVILYFGALGSIGLPKRAVIWIAVHKATVGLELCWNVWNFWSNEYLMIKMKILFILTLVYQVIRGGKVAKEMRVACEKAADEESP